MKIVDTWPDFQAFWSEARLKEVGEQLRLWRTAYMGKYPELFTKQVKNYQEANVNWQEIAKKILNALPNRYSLMLRARNNVVSTYSQVYSKAVENLRLDFTVFLVVYVGIGCGAGWATTYDNEPAVLLGLENIAEEKWHTKKKLAGLISHEIGHLAHMKWRNEWKDFEEAEEDPIFRLYSEGFAQRCEHLVLGAETWHMAQGKGWVSWCIENERWLAGEFLRRIKSEDSVSDFFGSWFKIRGRSQTGYFLGHGLVRRMERTYGLRKMALLRIDEVKGLGISYLESIVKHDLTD